MPITRSSIKTNVNLNNSYITITEGVVDKNDGLKCSYDKILIEYRAKIADLNTENLSLQEETNGIKRELANRNRECNLLKKRITIFEKKDNDLRHYKEENTFLKLEIDDIKAKLQGITSCGEEERQTADQVNYSFQEKIINFNKIIVDLNRMYTDLQCQYDNISSKLITLKNELGKDITSTILKKKTELQKDGGRYGKKTASHSTLMRPARTRPR